MYYDGTWSEIALEKAPRTVPALDFAGTLNGLATGRQSALGGGDPFSPADSRGPLRQPFARFEKSLEGSEMIVLRPSRQIGERDRLVGRAPCGLPCFLLKIRAFQPASNLTQELASSARPSSANAAQATAQRRAELQRPEPKRISPVRKPAPFRSQDWLICGLGGDQLPVRIARNRFPRKGPDICHFPDTLGIAWITSPALSRVADISSLTNLTVSARCRP